MSALEVITRGLDSSGRPLRGTRQIFQHFDRVNAEVSGKLVPVQGSFNIGTTASAGTHDRAGAFDVRTWNLTSSERERAQRCGRDPAIVGGAAWWYRTTAQGFDPHIHFVLLGDAPMTPQTQFQVDEYRAGRNGLANRRADDFWRPATIRNYQYIEDDMFTDKDRKTLEDLKAGFQTFRKNELSRDQAEVARDKERFSALVTLLGQQADLLGRVHDRVTDDATKTQLRTAKEQILLALKNDPDVDGVDNPSDEGMADAGI